MVWSGYREGQSLTLGSLCEFAVVFQSFTELAGFWVGVGLVYLKYFYLLTFCM